MEVIKIFSTLLATASFSMAAISGKVTNSTGSPIAGATVKLERGGPSVLTGSDGTFSLSGIVSIKAPQSDHSPTWPLSASIQKGIMRLELSEKELIEIKTYDLKGNLLASRQQQMKAGANSITLPKMESRIYLYKIQSQHHELLLKGNSIFGEAQNTQVSHLDINGNIALRKEAKTSAAINEVIAITKTGFLNYQAMVNNSDTSGLIIKMITAAGTVTDADGNVYQTIKIGNQEWMAENLRTTKFRDGTPIPMDTSTVTWSTATTPKFCFYNNTANADSIKKLGALYNWFTVNPTNANQIAPLGWHVPTDSERVVMETYLIAQGFNWDETTTENKIAKSLSSRVGWIKETGTGAVGNNMSINNSTGFSGFPAGTRDRDGLFSDYGASAAWWCGPQRDKQHSFRFLLFYNFENLFETMIDKRTGHSVRLVRDPVP